MYAMTSTSVSAFCTGIYKLPPYGTPAPLPNMALCLMGIDIFQKVSIEGAMVWSAPGSIPMSSGDEASAGAGGGIVSGRVKGESKALLSSTKVFFGGKGAVPFTSPIMHNANNMAFGSISGPPQCKVVIG